MQYLRLTARPPLEETPRTFRILVGSPHVTRTRWISWNLADGRGLTVLFHVVGDREAVSERLGGAPEIVAADTAPAEAGAFYLLATVNPTAATLVEPLYEVLQRDGVVLLPPVAKRDGAVEVELVGEPAAVSAVVTALPSAIDVEVHEVGARSLGVEHAAASLSERQREAVMAALELGYYDQPRGATHEDVAAALDCAPSTASQHLRKGEAKLVRDAATRYL